MNPPWQIHSIKKVTTNPGLPYYQLFEGFSMYLFKINSNN